MLQNILSLIYTEYKKFYKNRVVQLLLGSFLIAAPLIILYGKRLLKYSVPPMPSASTLLEFPSLWDYQAYINHHLIYILLGYFVIYTVTSEISNKTMRQNIITGYTRSEFFIAKLASYVIISITAALLYTLSCIMIGYIHTDGADISLMMDANWLPIRYILCCLGFMTFALFVSIWVRRSGLAMFFYFTYIIVLEQMVRGIYYYFVRNFETSRFAPMNVYEDLLPLPLYKLDGFFKMFDKQVELVLPTQYAIIGAVIYIVGFTYLAWYLFKTKDI